MTDRMPQRVREHQLADEAQAEFAYRVRRPHQFLPTSAQHEYGIDGHLELFDGSGSATGLRFPIQIKGTDDLQVKGVSIERRHYNYYRALEEPVLVVLYNAGTNELFARWFHSHPGPSRPDQMTFTFQFRAEDLWTEATLDSLRYSVEAFRLWRRPGLPRPIPLWVELDELSLPGVLSSEIAVSLRASYSEVNGLVAIRAGEHPPAQGVIEIARSHVRVNLSDVASITWRPSDGCTWTSGTARDGLELVRLWPKDLLVLLAAVLERVGQFDIASQLALEGVESAPSIADPSIATAVASAVLAAGRESELLDLAESLDSTGHEDSQFASGIFMLALRSHLEGLTARVRRKLISTCRQRIGRREGENDASGAEEHYNLANLLRSNSMGSERDVRDALRHYRAAARLLPNYRTRSYWLSEVAGAFFDLDFPRLSARYYKQAVDAGSPASVLALYADALLRSGQYEASSRAYEQYATVESMILPHERLAMHAVRVIMGVTGQHSQPGASVRSFGEAGASTGDNAAAVERRVRVELSSNGLNPLAWFNLGNAWQERGALRDAFWAYVVAATLEPWSVEDWARAAQLGIASQERLVPDEAQQDRGALVMSVLQASFAMVGDKLLQQLHSATTSWPHETRQALNNLLELVVAHHKDVYLQPFVIRHHSQDGTWEEVPVGEQRFLSWPAGP